MCRRPATASADSRRSDAESVLSASQHKPRPFVTAVKSQPACDKVSDWLSKDSYGQVPNYLVERQLEMAAQLAEEEVCTTATLNHSYQCMRRMVSCGVLGPQTVLMHIQRNTEPIRCLTGECIISRYEEPSTAHAVRFQLLMKGSTGAGSQRCSKYSRGHASASRG